MQTHHDSAEILTRVATSQRDSLEEAVLDALALPALTIRDQRSATRALAALDDLALTAMQAKARLRRHLEEGRKQGSEALTPDTTRITRNRA